MTAVVPTTMVRADTATRPAAAVKQANRRLYDAIAGRYEVLDGRRNDTLVSWVRGRLTVLAARHGNGVLLDLGSGSGLITRAARGIFTRTIAIDISPRILAAAGPAADHRIAADIDALPVAEATADVVSCFAVLHHLYDAGRLAREAARVLRLGGVFWSDHDMDVAFYRRFRRMLTGYRRLRGADRKYARAASDIYAETYTLAEYGENGVDAGRIVEQLKAAGLKPRLSFHWFGLSRVTNILFGHRPKRRGWAPLTSILAVKADGEES